MKYTAQRLDSWCRTYNSIKAPHEKVIMEYSCELNDREEREFLSIEWVNNKVSYLVIKILMNNTKALWREI